ncbi:hypothetical protein [Spirosoma aureum]|nr:hypothetical protein [Spirosoma aureum]
MWTIILDLLFNRTPQVTPVLNMVKGNELVIFVSPIWMGHIASPLRSCFQQLKARIGNYVFVSISGGADGANPKLDDELQMRLGKRPVALVDLSIATLLPAAPKPTRKDTSTYHLTARDVRSLTDTVVKRLRETLTLPAM